MSPNSDADLDQGYCHWAVVDLLAAGCYCCCFAGSADLPLVDFADSGYSGDFSFSHFSYSVIYCPFSISYADFGTKF